MRRLLLLTAAALTLSACAGATDPATTVTPSAPSTSTPDAGTGSAAPTNEDATTEFTVTEHGTFDEGWSMAFLPGTDLLLIAERVGALQLRDQATGEVREVSGVPEVLHDGQAGLHDVIPAPGFAQDGSVYLSWVRPAPEGAQGVVARATLDTGGDDAPALRDVEVIWEQTPTSGTGHFALRLLVQGEHLYVSSGDRQKFDPAQEPQTNLGKVLRLNLDGSPAAGNPFAGQGGRSDELWSIGHRNPLGIAADSEGGIWVSEMGPKGGDELNAIVEGKNFGWPQASQGDHYDGAPIPDHAPADGFHPPAASWNPSISPGSLLIYRGDLFAGWQDSALLGGLSGERIVRVALDPAAGSATPADEWGMGERIRALGEAPDGAIWVLEDGAGGRLLEVRPA